MKEKTKKVGALRFTKVWNFDLYRKKDNRLIEDMVREDVRVRLKKWIREHYTAEEPLTETFDVYSVYEVIGIRPQTMTTVSMKFGASVVNNELVSLEILEKKKLDKWNPKPLLRLLFNI